MNQTNQRKVKKMKLELKAVKHSEWASQETNCYQATIYLEGKPFASVQNEGFGGPTSIYCDHRFKGDMKDWNYKKERVNKYLQMNFEDVWDYEEAIVSWSDKALVDWLIMKDLRNAMKRKILFKKADGKLYEAKTTIEAIRSQFPDAQILNDMQTQEAFRIFSMA